MTFVKGDPLARKAALAYWGQRFDIERFWEKVDTWSSSKGCWEWRAAHDAKNYGKFKLTFSRKNASAHRFAWEDIMGPIPQWLQCLHRCDNPRCVNPKHLFLGTDKDNMQDAIRKGRLIHPKDPQDGRFIKWKRLP